MPSLQHTDGNKAANAVSLSFFVQIMWIDDLWAQGLPVQTGSHFPVALWFIGAAVLGVVMVYGILQNRKRTRAEQQITEQGTQDVYAQEDRLERGGNIGRQPARRAATGSQSREDRQQS